MLAARSRDDLGAVAAECRTRRRRRGDGGRARRPRPGGRGRDGRDGGPSTVGSTSWSSRPGSWATARSRTMPAAVFERVVDTAVHGTASVDRAVLPVFREQGGGHLHHRDLVAGLDPAPGVGRLHHGQVGSAGAGPGPAARDEVDARRPSARSRPAVDTPIYRSAANFAGRVGNPPPPVATAARLAAAVVRCADAAPADGVGRLDQPVHRPRLPALAPAVFDRLAGPLLPGRSQVGGRRSDRGQRVRPRRRRGLRSFARRLVPVVGADVAETTCGAVVGAGTTASSPPTRLADAGWDVAGARGRAGGRRGRRSTPDRAPASAPTCSASFYPMTAASPVMAWRSGLARHGLAGPTPRRCRPRPPRPPRACCSASTPTLTAKALDDEGAPATARRGSACRPSGPAMASAMLARLLGSVPAGARRPAGATAPRLDLHRPGPPSLPVRGLADERSRGDGPRAAAGRQRAARRRHALSRAQRPARLDARRAGPDRRLPGAGRRARPDRRRPRCAGWSALAARCRCGAPVDRIVLSTARPGRRRRRSPAPSIGRRRPCWRPATPRCSTAACSTSTHLPPAYAAGLRRFERASSTVEGQLGRRRSRCRGRDPQIGDGRHRAHRRLDSTS